MAVDAELVTEEAPARVNTAALSLVPPSLSDALVLQRDPLEVLAEASKAAKALMQVMASKKDKVMMNNQQYIENDDWQTIGHFYGVTAQIESDHFVEFGTAQGWEATAILVARDGRVLGRATAMCLNDEDKWCSRAKYEWHYVMKDGTILAEDAARQRGNSAMVWEEGTQGGKSRPKKQKVEVGTVAVPMFQLRSMAQTRASSKVHRTVLAFVPVLAGFSPTPAEEMNDAVRVENVPEAPALPEQREKPAAATVEARSTYLASVKQELTEKLKAAGLPVQEGPDLEADLPEGFHRIHDYRPDGQWHHITWGLDAAGGRPVYKTKLSKIGLKAQRAYNDGMAVQLKCAKFPWLDDVIRMDDEFGMSQADIAATRFQPEPPITVKDIPF